MLFISSLILWWRWWWYRLLELKLWLKLLFDLPYIKLLIRWLLLRVTTDLAGYLLILFRLFLYKFAWEMLSWMICLLMKKVGSLVYLLVKLRVLIDNTNRYSMYPSTLSSRISILLLVFYFRCLFLLGIKLHENWSFSTVIVMMKVLLLQLIVLLGYRVVLVSFLYCSLLIAHFFSFCKKHIGNCWSAIWLVSIAGSFLASCCLWRLCSPCINLINSGKAERFLRHHDQWSYKIWRCNDLLCYVSFLFF